MTKSDKIKIVIFSIIGVLCVALLVFYLVYPNLFTECLNTVSNYANQPLPIVGVSGVCAGSFIWKIFSSTKFGKKQLSEMETKITDATTTISEKELNIASVQAETSKIVSSYEEELASIKEVLLEVCETSPNKKVKAVGVKAKETFEKAQEKLASDLTSYTEVVAETKASTISDLATLKAELSELISKGKELYEKETNNE